MTERTQEQNVVPAIEREKDIELKVAHRIEARAEKNEEWGDAYLDLVAFTKDGEELGQVVSVYADPYGGLEISVYADTASLYKVRVRCHGCDAHYNSPC